MTVSRLAPSVLAGVPSRRAASRALATVSPAAASRFAPLSPAATALRIRRAQSHDYPAISSLIAANRGLDLTPRELAENGFVKGRWGVDRLAQLDGAPGFWIAEVTPKAAVAAAGGGANPPPAWQLVGAAVSTAPGADSMGPAGATNSRALQKFGGDYYLYGPVVVDSKFRGHGVLRKLNEAVFEATKDSYSHAVAFIEDMNVVSRVVHERLGWRAWDGFEVGGNRYNVFFHPTG